MVENAPAMRGNQFNIRFSKEETARLEEVAQHYGLNGAALVRMLLKKEHDRLLALRRKTLSAVDLAVLDGLVDEDEAMSVPHLGAALDNQYKKSEIGNAVRGLKSLGYIDLGPPEPRSGDAQYAITEKGKTLLKQ